MGDAAPTESEGGFNKEDQDQLDKDKRKIRLDNEAYLRQHPEIGMITAVVVSEVLRDAPADPVAYVSDFMTRPDLKARILQAGGEQGVA